MKMVKVLLPVLVCLVASALLAPVLNAQNPTKNYVILAKGQGKSSTNFASSLGPALTANLEQMESSPRLPLIRTLPLGQRPCLACRR